MVRRFPSPCLPLLCVVLCLGLSLPLCVSGQALSGLFSSLSTQNNPITPAFQPDVNIYEQQVPQASTVATFRAVLNDTAAAAGAQIFATWNGGAQFQMQDNTESAQQTLDPTQGTNTLVVTVFQSGAANESYFLSVTRSTIVSHNGDVLSFAWLDSNGNTVARQSDLVTMDPANFSTHVYSYAVQLVENVSIVRFQAAIDTSAVMHYTLTKYSIGPPLTQLSIMQGAGLGSNAIAPSFTVAPGQRMRLDINVVAEDGYTSHEYSFMLGSFNDPIPAAPIVVQPNLSSSSSSTAAGLEIGQAAHSATVSKLMLGLAAVAALALASFQ